MAGLALVISKGEPKTGMPQAIVDLGSAELGGIPVPIIVAAVMALMASFFLRRVAWGRWIYAAGGNLEGAVRAGIPYPRVIISVYVLSGIAAAIASILIAGRTASAYPTAGLQAELDAIAAVIIGGASFFGGRGTVSSAVVGALIIAAVRSGLNLAQIRPDWQQVAIGAIVVGAVLLDVWRAGARGVGPAAARVWSSTEGTRGAQAAERPVLEVREVSKYFGSVAALTDVSLELHKGETLAC